MCIDSVDNVSSGLLCIFLFRALRWSCYSWEWRGVLCEYVGGVSSVCTSEICCWTSYSESFFVGACLQHRGDCICFHLRIQIVVMLISNLFAPFSYWGSVCVIAFWVILIDVWSEDMCIWSTPDTLNQKTLAIIKLLLLSDQQQVCKGYCGW